MALTKKQLEYSRLWRNKNRDKCKAYMDKLKEQDPDYFKRYRTKYRTDPTAKNKHLARNAVLRYLKDGRLVKSPCEICSELKVEAHHDSYNKEDWTKVRWLCRVCHLKHHEKEGEML